MLKLLAPILLRVVSENSGASLMPHAVLPFMSTPARQVGAFYTVSWDITMLRTLEAEMHFTCVGCLKLS